MRLLLDTQCWLWVVSAPERFGASARRRVQDVRNELYLSAVSAMEISIKYAIGKLRLHIPPSEFIPVLMNYERTALLPVGFSHAIRLAGLPFHHRDPFDRLLIAQAQVEDLPVMTADPRFETYEVEVLSAS